MPTRNFRTLQQQATNQTLLREDAALRELARNLSEAVNAIRSELAGVYERYASNGVLTNAEMSKYNRLRSLESQIAKDLQPFVSRNDRLIEKISRVQYEESFYRRAWAIDQHLGVRLRWGLLNPDSVVAAVQNPLRELARRGLRQETLTRVRRAITQGIVRGVSLPQMAREVRQAMVVTRRDAERIVRTEAHRAREIGNEQVTRDAIDKGVNIIRTWDATLDNRTRPEHAQIDGQQKKPGEDFRFPDGIETPRPGSSGVAYHDINCRCTIIDEVVELQGTARRAREKGRQPYQTFTEWAQANGVTASRYGKKYNFVR